MWKPPIFFLAMMLVTIIGVSGKRGNVDRSGKETGGSSKGKAVPSTISKTGSIDDMQLFYQQLHHHNLAAPMMRPQPVRPIAAPSGPTGDSGISGYKAYALSSTKDKYRDLEYNAPRGSNPSREDREESEMSYNRPRSEQRILWQTLEGRAQLEDERERVKERRREEESHVRAGSEESVDFIPPPPKKKAKYSRKTAAGSSGKKK